MKKIAVLASGGGTNFQAIIDGCASGKIDGEVVLLIYNRVDSYARNRAENAGILSKYVNRVKSGGVENMKRQVYEELVSSGVDVIVLAGYLEKLSPMVVEKWENKIINTHPSLIPKFCGEGYYGNRVHKAVIENGEKVSGCSIHLVDDNYDTGPIIMQHIVQVEANDTPESLAKKILPHEHHLLVESVVLLCSGRVKVKEGRAYII